MSNLTKAFVGIYFTALAISAGLLLWLVIEVATGYLLHRRLLLVPPVMPWLPIAAIITFAAKYLAGWSARRGSL